MAHLTHPQAHDGTLRRGGSSAGERCSSLSFVIVGVVALLLATSAVSERLVG